MRIPPLLAVLLAVGGCARPTPAPAPNDPPPRERIESPLYRSWAGFKTGTAVVHRAVTGAEGQPNTTTTTTTTTLVERGDDRVMIESVSTTRRYDGTEIRNPPERFDAPRWLPLPPGVTPADAGRREGEAVQEAVTVGGREYQARRTTTKDRNEAGEMFVTTWTSAAVPGGLVKSVTRTPAIGKTTTRELVEVKLP